MGRNNFFYGIITSIAVTIFGAGLIYVWRYLPNNFSLQDFITDITDMGIKTSAVLSLALLANIPLIFFNQKRHNYKTITGIAVVLFSIVLIILESKFNFIK
jgi:hypothetical protein